MITAFIVLTAIALALGAYIVYDALHGKTNKSVAETAAVFDVPQATEKETVSKTEAENNEKPIPESDETNDDELSNDIDDDKDDEITKIMSVSENGKKRYIVIKYSKSFLAKLIQSDEQTKQYYSEIKNRLLSYDGIKNRISWKWEAFRYGKKTVAKLRLRGKTLTLCLAPNADGYAETKYCVENFAEIKSYADTPYLYRIKNDMRLRYSFELIADVMKQLGIAEKNIERINYVSQYPYEETDALIERKLIKVLTDKDAQSGTKFKQTEIRKSVTAQEVDKIMTDEVAASLVEKSESITDKTKQGIINIDTLSQTFESGEVVTLDEIKNRIKGFNRKTTYVKVLARGVIDKPLIIEADAFSIQAVKMIVLTGGKAIKKN